MNFFVALLAWLAIAALMVTAVVLAVKGSLLLLILCLVGFVFTFSWYGCLSH